MENKMLEMFEIVGELLTIKGMDKMIDEYAKLPESSRAAKQGMRMKLCSACVKAKPQMMEKLAVMETGKTLDEIRAMSESEYSGMMMAITLNLVAPFLAQDPPMGGTT